jgi:SAM-dependent methyltransferase
MNVNSDFLPKIIHPFYFIRSGLYSGIKKRSKQLTGVLLDFGCGQKPYLPLFEVDRYIGLDYENPGHNHKNENIDVFYDGKNIPFSDGYFDSVLCSEVFEHLFDIDNTLQEIHRVLKNGGKLLITCPFVWNEHEIPHDYARYTVFALKHLFSKHGFQVIDFEKTGSFVRAITQMRVLYFYYNITPILVKFPGGKYLSRLLIAFLNSCGLCKDFLLPERYDLYLSNIFLVEKL